jgi:hypothetical protein
MLPPEPYRVGIKSSVLVSYIGLFTTTLVAGILHVYPAPAERIALKRPMLTTGSVATYVQTSPPIPFSAVKLQVKSAFVVAYGIRDQSILLVDDVVSNHRYKNKSTSFVASSALPRLQLFVPALKFVVNVLVIVLTTPPIIIFTGFSVVGSLPS